MVLLPEERGMTLEELRQIAAHQQHQIDAQHQLLVAKEQRLKFLKQQEARHHNLSEQHLETNCLITLRGKVESQQLKLKQLRALHGQVEQQKTNNSNLGTELDSIRALFCEKEKELDLAVHKVEQLTRQLEEIKNNSRKHYHISTTSELENLRRELIYRTKLSEQQNNYICQQREKINLKQQDIVNLDKKINELNERLHRKRLFNEQYAAQINLSPISQNSDSSIIRNNMLMKTESRVPDTLELEHTQDDLAANLHGHKCDLGEFSLTKKDPKYQTLPYNTKFTLKEKHLEDSSSSSTDEELAFSKTEALSNKKSTKPFSNMCNFSPRPFIINSGEQKNNSHLNNEDGSSVSQGKEVVSNENNCSANIIQETKADTSEIDNKSQESTNVKLPNDITPNQSSKSVASMSKPQSLPKSVKPAIPPKPALYVKPVLANRENKNLSVKKASLEQDSVSKALSFLENKSSEKEKSDIRYSSARDPPQDPLLPKSRILTYFSKTILQPEGGVSEQSEAVSSSESPKRKSVFGQLPIKPKPLTIRKNPSIEPPKLKAQSLTSSYRKITESPSKATKNFPALETDDKVTNFIARKCNNSIDPVNETENFKTESEFKADKTEIQGNVGINAELESTSIKSNEETELASEGTDSSSDESDVDEVDLLSSDSHRGKKGNLKGEGSIRGCRRVSFDPLALLLDAALEGELELVKKIASEVVNPSAANDEGITALHNAICAGQFEVVKFLVEFGCDVNAPDSDGWTPLHCAASCNNLAMVKFLIERGACIFATTMSDQETAAEKCEEDGAGFDGCSEYLFSLQENLGVMNNGIVYAVYDYDVQNADELSFKNGDMLTVLRRSDDEENEWWWCRLHDEEGYVPRNLLGLYPRVTCAGANADKTT